jgi:hypothetical protein
MKTEFGACPPPYKVERIGEHSAKITFAENAVEIKTESGSRWEADEYSLTVGYTANLEERVKSNPLAWVQRAKDAITIESAPTIDERLAAVETVVKGTPSYGELLEAVNILLGE